MSTHIVSKLSIAEENYLRAIYKLSGDQSEKVQTTLLAEHLNTTAASATDMIKRLDEKKLLRHKPYYGVVLSETGKTIARNLVRKHRLWEVFLVDKLKFKWDEVHEIAEQLEHIQSADLIEKLDRFLGNPKYDPHGDPIPDASGYIKERKQCALSELLPGDTCQVVGVADNATSFLKFLDKIEVALGTEISILQINEFDKSIEVKIDGKKEQLLSDNAAKNIYAVIV